MIEEDIYFKMPPLNKKRCAAFIVHPKTYILVVIGDYHFVAKEKALIKVV